MITERGVITAIDDNLITVSCRSRMDCARCAEGKGCGGGILALWLGNRQFQVQAFFDPNHQSPNNGELVSIGLPSSLLVRLAAVMYGLPLLFLIIGLLIQVQILPSATDFVSILVALFSLLAGFKLSAHLISRANAKGQLLPQLQSADAELAAIKSKCQKLG